MGKFEGEIFNCFPMWKLFHTQNFADEEIFMDLVLN